MAGGYYKKYISGENSQSSSQSNASPKRSYYKEYVKKEVPKTENLLQRMGKAAQSIPINQAAYTMMGGAAPGEIGATLGSKMMGGPSMMGVGAQAESSREKATEGNPIARFLTDPISLAGAVEGGILAKNAAKGIGNFIVKKSPQSVQNVLTKSGRLKYMDKMENAVYEARSSASPKFKAHLDKLASDNPNASVDMNDILGSISKSENPSVLRIIDDTPELQEILTKPGNVSIHEAQKALNALTSKVSSSKLAGQARRSSDFPVLDLVDDLKMSMSKSFPGLKQARKEYGDIVNNFRTVRGKLKGDAASKNLFADYNPFNPRGKEFMGGERSEEAFKQLVPEKTFKEAITTRRVKTAKDVGQTAGGGLLLESIRRKVMR